jgi:hypothetical protein
MRRNFNSTSIQFRTQIEKKNYQKKKSKKIRRSETERTERLRSGGASAAAGDRLRKMKIRVQVEVAGLCLSLSRVVLFAEVVNSNSFCPFLFLLFALIFIFYSGKKKFVWVKPGQVPSLAGPWIRL